MPNPTPANHKILLIEDDEQLQKSYQTLFTAEGFQVFQGFTGDQGLQLAKQERPDIIILDIMLKGGVNGFDVLERLKKDRDLFNIPVLMLTNLDSERKLALSIGAVDYLVKANTSIDLLLEKVKNYIGQSLTTFAEDTSQFGEAPAATATPLATPPSATVSSATPPLATSISTPPSVPPVSSATSNAVTPMPAVSSSSTMTSTPASTSPAQAIGSSASSQEAPGIAVVPMTPSSQPASVSTSPSSPSTIPPMTSEGSQPNAKPVPQPLPDKSPMTL